MTAEFDIVGALNREVQLRTNYEQNLIPQMERDLQAARRDVEALVKERDALLAWKTRASHAITLLEPGAEKINDALALFPAD